MTRKTLTSLIAVFFCYIVAAAGASVLITGSAATAAGHDWTGDNCGGRAGVAGSCVYVHDAGTYLTNAHAGAGQVQWTYYANEKYFSPIAGSSQCDTVKLGIGPFTGVEGNPLTHAYYNIRGC